MEDTEYARKLQRINRMSSQKDKYPGFKDCEHFGRYKCSLLKVRDCTIFGKCKFYIKSPAVQQHRTGKRNNK